MNNGQTRQSLKRDLQIVVWNASGLSLRCPGLLNSMGVTTLTCLCIRRKALDPLPNYMYYRDEWIDRAERGMAIMVKAYISPVSYTHLDVYKRQS